MVNKKAKIKATTIEKACVDACSFVLDSTKEKTKEIRPTQLIPAIAASSPPFDETCFLPSTTIINIIIKATSQVSEIYTSHVSILISSKFGRMVTAQIKNHRYAAAFGPFLQSMIFLFMWLLVFSWHSVNLDYIEEYF